MNIVVVGGGPTGVEISGSLAEMRHARAAQRLPRAGPEADAAFSWSRPGRRVLGPMSEASQADARRYLEELGVQVRLNTAIKRFENCTGVLF
ncbi:MAG: FAD-dependent oxidoreductase [Hymenobacter sp.]